MADEKLPLILQAGVPGGIAAVLQLGMALAIGKLPPAIQLVGAIIVAGLVGGGVSVACVEGLHFSSVLAGILGGATGAVPAVFWASVAQAVAKQQVQQRLGVEAEQQSVPALSPNSISTPPAPTPETTPQEVKKDAP